MRVLFLDIDGVLNCRRSQFAFGAYPHSFRTRCMTMFDWVAVGMVRRLCAATDTMVVLSSDWRLERECSPHLTANALDLPIIDGTPSLPGRRGHEIAAWLAAHPEVTTYAIVDDRDAMLPHQRPFFVRTCEREGLTLRDVSALRRILTGRASPVMTTPVERAEAAEAGERHWRANHAHMVARCALLSQRDDLPVDRLPAYRELVRLQALVDALSADRLRPDAA